MREEVSKRWLDPFCALLPSVDPAVISHKLCDFALGKCDSTSTVTSRYICSRMWGAMAPHLTPQFIEKYAPLRCLSVAVQPTCFCFFVVAHRKLLKAAMEMCQVCGACVVAVAGRLVVALMGDG